MKPLLAILFSLLPLLTTPVADGAEHFRELPEMQRDTLLQKREQPIQPRVRPYHLTTPSWWEIPSGASLLCAVAGDLQHPMSFSAWYDAAQNKVWLMYHR